MRIEMLKRTWFTSDWHCGHNHILTFCPNSRGHFKSVEEMEKQLITNYNEMIGPNDVCYFLGDFSFKGSTYSKAILSRLSGTKILVRGNHDKGHQASINAGFSASMDSLSIKINDIYITASHFPLTGIKREKCELFKSYNGTDNWHGEEKYAKDYVLLGDTGQDLHLHGHLHAPNRGMSEPIQGKQFDVGVDANGLRPVSLTYIISKMKHHKP